MIDKYGGGCAACNYKWCMICKLNPCVEDTCTECGFERIHYKPRSFCPFCGKPLTPDGEEMFVLRLKNIIGKEKWPY